MLKRLISTAAVTALIFAVQGAHALPLNNLNDSAAPGVTLVSGGCGPFAHRGPFGGCRPNGPGGYPGGRVCPPGFHLGPHGARCWPN